MTDGRRFNEDSSRRFTRRPDGVIVDHERGLEWFALARTRNWDELTLEPFTAVPGEGWRVPTRAELQTLLAARKNAEHLWLDPVFEGVAHVSHVWTDDWGDTLDVVWSFDFERAKPVKDWTHPTHHLGVLLLRELR